MAKCIDLSKVRGGIKAAIMAYKFSGKGLNFLKEQISLIIKDTSQDLEADSFETVVGTMYNALPKGIVQLAPEFFNPQNIRDLLLGYNLDLIDTLEVSVDNIIQNELAQIQLRRNVTSEFIDTAFGAVTDAKMYFLRISDLSLFDVMFINRYGTLKGLDIGTVKLSDLNTNIKKFQQLLLDKIFKYFDSILTPDLDIALEAKEALLGSRLLYKNETNTGVLDKLSSLIDSYLSPKVFRSSYDPTGRNMDTLRSLYNRVMNKSELPSKLDRLWFEAYNAAVLLLNFDEYLQVTLGDLLEINDFHLKTGKNNKYSLGTRLAKLLTTWTTSELRDVEGTSDFISKLAVNTSLLYYWQNDTPISGWTLLFADLQYITGKIKDLAFAPESFLTFSLAILKTVSLETNEVINGKTFRQVIAGIRKNPRKYTSAVFELLCNLEFKKRFAPLYNNFSNGDLNKLYSLYKGIFSPSEGRSIYKLSEAFGNNDYYAFLTLIADTIFNVNYILYYRDEEGILKPRTFLSLNVNNLRRKLETSINSYNSTTNIKDITKFVDKYNISIPTINTITFEIPDTNITATVSTMGTCVFKENGVPIKNLGSLWTNKAVLRFIDSKLRLGIYENPDLQNILKHQFKNNLALVTLNLLSLSSRIVCRLYFIKNSIDSISDEGDKAKKILELFGTDSPTYNKLLLTINTIGNYDVNTLKEMAIALASFRGITTATLVKDGEGNGQNLLTQSRLIGALTALFELIEKLPDSATKDCLILNIPGLYEGAFTAKEYYSTADGSKAFTDMSVAEHTYSNFLFDFIGGLELRSNDEDYIAGNGHVMFLPSVYSDKNTIGRIVINLNLKTTLNNGETKAFRDLNEVELLEVIAKSIGKIYIRMYEKILSDFNKLLQFIERVQPLAPKIDYLSGFAEFNAWCALLKVSPESQIKKFVSLYNNYVDPNTGISNRIKPIELIDQTYFKVGKTTINGVEIKNALIPNLVVIAQIARFNPEYLSSKGINPEQYPSSSEFWNLKKKDLLKSLLKAKFSINTTGKTLAEYKHLREVKGNWVNPSGDMILAKIQGKSIASLKDLRKLDKSGDLNTIIDALNPDDIVIHPELLQWNYLDYLFTLEYMNCTVGSFVNHPDKADVKGLSLKLAVLVQEAGCYNALHKRNVSLTASMHEFALNLLNGITEEYNIATIEDIKDVQGTVLGALNTIKPFDGATFVNPFVVLLENNSLCGARAGITKKQFIHFKNGSTGTGGIIKTCGFGLTNDWIRTSPFLLTMMRRMTNHVWLNEDGTEADVDITHDYDNNKICHENLYFKKGNRVFEIVNIKKVGRNTYTRFLKEIKIDKKGNPIYNDYVSENVIVEQPTVINNNYDLWNYLGGKDSMTIDSTNPLILSYSNISVERVVEIMNRVGTRKHFGLISTLDDLYLPLKHSDVHYVATAGAVKQGAANINSADKYSSAEELSKIKGIKVSEDDLKFDILKIKMYQAGIQLDKEHHADLAKLSLMTQVISACAANGWTFENASAIYNALAESTRINTQEHLDGLKELVEADDRSKLLEVMYEAIINSFATAKNANSFAFYVAMDIKRLLLEGKNIRYSEAALPLSDSTIYSKICSTVASYLNSTGIKFKVPGILSVLTPSYGINKIHAGRKYESFTNPEEELAEIQKTYDANPVFDKTNPKTNISNTEIGRTYKVTRLVQSLNGSLSGDVFYTEFLNPDLIEGERLVSEDGQYDTINIYLKGLKDKGNFELIKDNKNNLYAILANATAFTNEELNTLYLQVRNILPDGATIAILEKESPENISILNSLLEEYNKIDTKTIQDSNGNNVEVPIYLKPLVYEEVEYSEYIGTHLDYKRLRDDAKNGSVTRVVEDVITGRDLAAYNARFEVFNPSTLDIEQFLLYDLDSISMFCEIEHIKSKKLSPLETKAEILSITSKLFPNVDVEMAQIYLKRMVLRDLCALSPSGRDILSLYDKMKAALDFNSPNAYEIYTRWVNIYLSNGLGANLRIPGVNVSVINAANFLEVEPYIRKYIQDTTMVRIDGKLRKVNKASLKILPYEIILPKVFKSNYGLSEFTDLNAVVNNTEFFVELYQENSIVKTASLDYSIALKNSTGEHTLLITKSLVDPNRLTKVNDDYLGKVILDGKTFRCDNKGNILYEITEDFELYIDLYGKEIIATDNLAFYMNNLSYDSLEISGIIVSRLDVYDKLMKQLRLTKNRIAKNFYKHISYGDDITNRVVYANNLSYNALPKPGTPEYELSYIIKQLHEKHSSFVKSLEVIAARIPSLSMQSFMPMKIVAFDNPDVNTAFVSTMQILLQGSDYDVDAVSVMMYDIDRYGRLKLWSPYANLSTVPMLEASMKIPQPTGKALEIKEGRGYLNSIAFFNKYRKILSITRKGVLKPSETELEAYVELKDPEDVELLAEMLLEIKTLEAPSKRYYENFAKKVQELNAIEGFTTQHIPSLFVELKRIADDHNLYYESLSPHTLTRITNNISMYNTFLTSADPINLIESLTPVDETTGPLKNKCKESAEFAAALSRTPGNAVNKFEGIDENQTGKDGISICAVGLKSFFGLTQYCNYLLNYGNVEEQQRILLGKDGKKINGKVYKTIANIRALDLNTIKNSEVFKALSEVTQDEDIALTLSALLSLATDNAKELALSKLNAGTEMLGMYIYGLTIGMRFNDVANILMSKCGNVIRSVLKGNKFAEYDGFNVVNRRIFEYFTKGPERHLMSFYKKTFTEGKVAVNPLLALFKLIHSNPLFLETFENKKEGNKFSLASYLPFLGMHKVDSLSVDTIIEFLEDARSEYDGRLDDGSGISTESIERYNQLIDFVEEYVILSDIILNDKHNFFALRTLSDGAQELKLLGQILGLNLGVNTATGDLFSLVNSFKYLIYNRVLELNRQKGNKSKPDPNLVVDINKFLLDEGYRNSIIDKYEQVKDSINIYDVVSKIPHFEKYLHILATTNLEMSESFIYRSASNLFLGLLDKIKGYVDLEKLFKGLLDYCNDWLKRLWMLDNDIRIVIPAGNLIFDRKGNQYTSTEDIEILLGTLYANATFRAWMESEVVPNLKDGIIKEGTKWDMISNNKFIRDLGNDILNKTISRNPTNVLTLPINMLPNNNFELALLDLYRALFNSLANSYYHVDYTKKIVNEDNSITQEKHSAKYSITDLFTYYAMIAHNWKLNESSLVPVLKDMENSGIIEDYHKYVKEVDSSGFTLANSMLDLQNLYPYVAPRDNPYKTSKGIIFAYDPNSKLRSVMVRDAEGHGYFSYGVAPHPNFYTTNFVDSNLQRIITENDNKVIYDIETRKITSLKDSSGNKITIDTMEMPMKKIGKRRVPDTMALDDRIESSKCKNK